MQQTIGPKRISFPKTESLRDLRELFYERVHACPDGEAIIYRNEPESPETVISYQKLEQDVGYLGEVLCLPDYQLVPDTVLAETEGPCALDLHRPRFAILGENRYEWILAHLAISFGAGLSIPLDRQLAADEALNLLSRAHATVLFLHYEKEEVLRGVLAQPQELKKLILFGPDPKACLARLEAEGLLNASLEVICFEDLLFLGQKLKEQGSSLFDSCPIKPEAPMAIYFTSGTTAMSKGVLLSHKNVLSNVLSCAQSVDINNCHRGLSVLPLHHTFENTVGIFAYLFTGITCCIASSLRYIQRDLKEWHIDVLICVPLLLEKLQSAVLKKLKRGGLEARFEKGRKISSTLLKFRLDFRRKIFSQLLSQLAPDLKKIIVGAAALSPEVQQFFNDIGISTYGGYGLTETSPVLSCCNRWFNKMGSVGQPIKGFEIRIDGDEVDEQGHTRGEILARCPSIMCGYYLNQEQTNEVIDADGWFHTGDIGYLDEDGVLFITGRAKSMIVLQNGKKIFPEEPESLIAPTPGVVAVMVYKELSNFSKDDICVRLQIDPSALPEEIERNDAAIAAYLRQVIDEVNQKMAEYKAIRYCIWNEEPPVMTGTLKIKRNEELKSIQARLKAAGKDVHTANFERF